MGFRSRVRQYVRSLTARRRSQGAAVNFSTPVPPPSTTPGTVLSPISEESSHLRTLESESRSTLDREHPRVIIVDTTPTPISFNADALTIPSPGPTPPPTHNHRSGRRTITPILSNNNVNTNVNTSQTGPQFQNTAQIQNQHNNNIDSSSSARSLYSDQYVPLGPSKCFIVPAGKDDYLVHILHPVQTTDIDRNSVRPEEIKILAPNAYYSLKIGRCVLLQCGHQHWIARVLLRIPAERSPQVPVVDLKEQEQVDQSLSTGALGGDVVTASPQPIDPNAFISESGDLSGITLLHTPARVRQMRTIGIGLPESRPRPRSMDSSMEYSRDMNAYAHRDRNLETVTSRDHERIQGGQNEPNSSSQVSSSNQVNSGPTSTTGQIQVRNPSPPPVDTSMLQQQQPEHVPRQNQNIGIGISQFRTQPRPDSFDHSAYFSHSGIIAVPVDIQVHNRRDSNTAPLVSKESNFNTGNSNQNYIQPQSQIVYERSRNSFEGGQRHGSSMARKSFEYDRRRNSQQTYQEDIHPDPDTISGSEHMGSSLSDLRDLPGFGTPYVPPSGESSGWNTPQALPHSPPRQINRVLWPRRTYTQGWSQPPYVPDSSSESLPNPMSDDDRERQRHSQYVYPQGTATLAGPGVVPSYPPGFVPYHQVPPPQQPFRTPPSSRVPDGGWYYTEYVGYSQGPPPQPQPSPYVRFSDKATVNVHDREELVAEMREVPLVSVPANTPPPPPPAAAGALRSAGTGSPSKKRHSNTIALPPSPSSPETNSESEMSPE